MLRCSFRTLVAAVLAALLLSACSQEPQVQRPTVPPRPSTAAATPAAPTVAVPTPTAMALSLTPTAPTPAASAPATALPGATTQPGAAVTPVPGALVLPTPLYFLEQGQIHRLERDGVTRTQITNEANPGSRRGAVQEFDISPADGALAYIIVEGERTMLIQSDARGKNRHVLLALPSEQVGFPRWSPDGSTVAVRISPDPDIASELVGGVYLVKAASSAAQTQPPAPPAAAGQVYLPLISLSNPPRLLHGDDPHDVERMPPSLYYAPVAWSPDGKRLLLDGQRQFGNFCIIAVKNLDTGDLTVPEPRIPDHDDAVSRCGEATWNHDGSGLLLNIQILGLPVSAPGLWSVAADRKRIEPLIPGEQNGEATLTLAPQQRSDGSIYLFLSKTTQKPDPTYSPPLRFTMYRLTTDWRQEQLRLEQDLLRQAIWSPNGEGAAVLRLEGVTPSLTWLPSDGGPAVTLPARGSALTNLRWGM